MLMWILTVYLSFKTTNTTKDSHVKNNTAEILAAIVCLLALLFFVRSVLTSDVTGPFAMPLKDLFGLLAIIGVAYSLTKAKEHSQNIADVLDSQLKLLYENYVNALIFIPSSISDPSHPFINKSQLKVLDEFTHSVVGKLKTETDDKLKILVQNLINKSTELLNTDASTSALDKILGETLSNITALRVYIINNGESFDYNESSNDDKSFNK